MSSTEVKTVTYRKKEKKKKILKEQSDQGLHCLFAILSASLQGQLYSVHCNLEWTCIYDSTETVDGFRV